MAAALGKRSCVLGFNETKSALLVAITLPCFLLISGLRVQAG